MLSILKRAGLAVLLVVGGALVPTHGQSPPPLVFEPGFEGEIWQALPKFGRRIGPQCVPSWVPAQDDFGNPAGFDTPYPDVLTGNLCTPDQVPLDEMLFPTDVAVYVRPGDAPTASGFPASYRAYVADIWNHRVLVFGPGTNGTWTPLGAFLEPLDQPNAVAVDADGNVWVADVVAGVLVFNDGGELVASLRPSLPDGTLLSPYGIALAPGAAWGRPGRAAFTAQNQVSSPWDQVLGILDTASGNEVGRISSPYGSGPDEWAGILEPAYHVDPLGTVRLVVADGDNSRLKVLDLDDQGVPLPAPQLIFGNTMLQGDPRSLVQQPYGVAIDRRGRVLVGDTVNQRMSAFKLDLTPGAPSPVQYLFQLNADGGLNGFPRGIAEDPYGRLLIVDTANHEVEVFDIPDLAIVDVVVSPSPGRPGKPVAVDFSVVVPDTKYQVVDVMPTCQVADGATTTLLTPFASGGTDSTLPLPLLRPLEVARYRCIYTPPGGTTLEFALGASGNRVDTTSVTAAPAKIATALVIDCAACEETPPVVSAAVSAPAPVNGFYPSPASVTINASDVAPAGYALGGVKRIYWRWFGAMAPSPIPALRRCPGEPAGVQCAEFASPYLPSQAVSVSAPLSGRSTLQFWADDGFDNKSTIGELTFTIDQEPPTVTFVHSPAANAHGWWNTPVTITYKLFDDWTGEGSIAIVPPSIPHGLVVSTEGAGQTFSVTAQDLAGNRRTVSTSINLDMTPPTTSASTSSDLSGPRTVTLRATDALSGVQFTTYTLSGATTAAPQTYLGPLVLANPGTTRVTFYSVDHAGNAEAEQIVDVFVNAPPVAADDAAVVDEDTLVTIRVLDNDTDANPGDVLTPVLVTTSPSGTALVNPDGTIRFTPNANFNGTATFTYRVTDTQGAQSAPATVTVTVRSVNDAPVATDDSAAVLVGQSVVIDVLANDVDVDRATNGDDLTPVVASPSPNGTAVVNANGTVTFTPAAGFVGTAVFTYRARDAAGAESNLATVSVTVRPVNQPPVCSVAYAWPGEIWPPNHTRWYAVTVKGVTDPDGERVTIQITGIFQDEPVDTTGDGRFAPDGGGVGTATAWVRAERQGSGNGRVYEIWFTAADSQGDSCTGKVYTTVPKSRGQPWQVIDSGVRYDSTRLVRGTCQWDDDRERHVHWWDWPDRNGTKRDDDRDHDQRSKTPDRKGPGRDEEHRDRSSGSG